jgi:hypothetical protein
MQDIGLDVQVTLQFHQKIIYVLYSMQSRTDFDFDTVGV